MVSDSFWEMGESLVFRLMAFCMNLEVEVSSLVRERQAFFLSGVSSMEQVSFSLEDPSLRF